MFLNQDKSTQLLMAHVTRSFFGVIKVPNLAISTGQKAKVFFVGHPWWPSVFNMSCPLLKNVYLGSGLVA